MIRPTLRVGTWLAIGTVALIGALNALGYLLTPLLESHSDRVTAYLSEATGLDLEVGELHAHWSGRGPVLQLDRVRARTADGDSLRLERALVDLHLPAVLSGELIRITLKGLRLELERTPDDRIQLADAGKSDAESDGEAAPATMAFDDLPAHLRLLDAELYLRDRKTGARPLRIAPIDFELHNEGGRVRLAARLKSAGGSLRAAAALEHAHGDAGASGRIRIATENLDQIGRAHV